MIKIYYKDLLLFTKKVLNNINLDKFSNDSVSHGLCDASLRGVDSHGIKLLRHYVNVGITKRKNPKPKFKFIKKYPCLQVLDADHAYGLAAGMKAIDKGIQIAKKYGVGMIPVTNSTHPGALASIAMRASKKGYAAFAFTHADSLMLSHNSSERYFGTNPICFTCPRDGEEPYCLDMSTTVISWNKLLNYRNNSKKFKGYIAADIKGNLTRDPKKANSLRPIGDYKGFGLASMIEIISGIYTGMPFGHMILPMFTIPNDKKRSLGQFYIVFKVDGYLTKKEFSKKVKIMSNQIRNLKPSKTKKVLVPNDPEINMSKIRIKSGIPLDKNTYQDLKYLSKKYSVKLKTFK